MPTEQKSNDPNFAGEAMRVPEGTQGKSATAAKGNSFGVVLAVLFTLLVLILAGLWFWYTTILNRPTVVLPEPTRPTAEENQEPESTTAEAQAGVFNVVSTSNELTAIEADVQSTNLDSLDDEMTAIEAEMNANTTKTGQ